jgi:hypothetical protein
MFIGFMVIVSMLARTNIDAHGKPARSHSRSVRSGNQGTASREVRRPTAQRICGHT